MGRVGGSLWNLRKPPTVYCSKLETRNMDPQFKDNLTALLASPAAAGRNMGLLPEMRCWREEKPAVLGLLKL